MKNIKKYLLLGMGLVGLNSLLTAQEDIHFSQFMTAPLNINPATAGIFDGDMRLFTHYRTQWASVTTPYNTIAASADFKLFQKKMNGSFFGLGVNFFTDQAGDSHLTSNKYNLSLSYVLDLNGDGTNYLSAGLQGGFLQRSISFADVSWDDQYTGLGFDNSLPTNETFGSESATAIDLGGGIYWDYKYSDETHFFAGVSSFHINAPDISFLGSTDKYIRKYVVHGGGEFLIKNSSTTVLPNAILVLQGPNQIINLGSDLRFRISEPARFTDYGSETSIQFGAYYRFKDALFATFRFNYANFALGFSYDFNISSIQQVNLGSGSMEAMLSYKAYLNPKEKFHRVKK